MYSFDKVGELFKQFTTHPLMKTSAIVGFHEWEKSLESPPTPLTQQPNYLADWRRLPEFTVNKGDSIEKYKFQAQDDGEIQSELTSIFGDKMMPYIKHNAHQSGFIECGRAFLQSYISNRIIFNGFDERNAEDVIFPTIVNHSAETASRTFTVTDDTVDTSITTALTGFTIIDSKVGMCCFTFSKPIVLSSTISVSKEKAIAGEDDKSILSSSCEILTGEVNEHDKNASEQDANNNSTITEIDIIKEDVSYDYEKNAYILPQNLALALFDDEFPYDCVAPNHDNFIDTLKVFSALKAEGIMFGGITSDDFFNIVQAFAALKSEKGNNIEEIIQKCRTKISVVTLPGLITCGALYDVWKFEGERGDFSSYVDQRSDNFANLAKDNLYKYPSNDLQSKMFFNSQVGEYEVSDDDHTGAILQKKNILRAVNITRDNFKAELQEQRVSDARRNLMSNIGMSVAGVIAVMSVAVSIVMALDKFNVLKHNIFFSAQGAADAVSNGTVAFAATVTLSVMLCAMAVLMFVQTRDQQKHPTEETAKEVRQSVEESVTKKMAQDIIKQNVDDNKPSSKETEVKVEELGNSGRKNTVSPCL